jgi:N-acyl-D-amino-acid deacylase
MFDILISGGKLIDGTGNPWVRADVGIISDRIAAVGRLYGESAARTIDVDGLFVCPGFVDMHTHSDLQLLVNPTWDIKIAQGVTLEVLGQDGLGLAPITEETGELLRQQLKAWNGDPAEVAWNWRGIGDYLDHFDGSVAPNVAMLVPHGTVRLDVMGMDQRAPTSAELSAMQDLVEQGMRDGAVGLSAGLTYAPAMFSDDDELVELCRVLRPFGGYYAPHHRNYGSRAMQAYADSIDIGRRAGVPVHLTHAHLSYPNNRGRAAEFLEMIDRARDEGVEVTLDSYPYLAGNTYLHAYLPSWVHAGGRSAILERLANVDARRKIQHEMEEVGSDGFHGVPMDWEWIVISGVSHSEHRVFVGKNIADAAGQAPGGRSPFDFYCDLLLEDELGVSSLVFTGNEENLRTILQHPAHMAGSDGIVVGDRPHPRAWGTFVRYLGVYARDLGLLRLEDMVRKMTSQPAVRLGFFDRGVLRPGAAADVVAFDGDHVRDVSTYDDPKRLAEGVPYVLVNGRVVVDQARLTGALPGRALRKRQLAGVANR